VGKRELSEWDEEEDDSDVFGEIERTIDEAFSGFHRSLFDLERRCLKPLYRIEASEEYVTATFDLPCVESKQDLVLNATEDSFNLEAKMKRPVSLMVGGPYQKNVEFDKYSKKVRLPAKVYPEKAKARFSNGVLVVQFPIRKKPSSSSVKID
jgi:HSP20 family protein